MHKRIKRGLVRLGTLFATAGVALAVGPAAAQEPAPSDATVDLNEGVYYYLRALSEQEESYLDDAISRFSSALDIAPFDRPALLFRALARGERALGLGKNRKEAKGDNQLNDFMLKLRSDPEKLASLKQEDEELDAKLADETLSTADRVYYQRRKALITKELSLFQLWTNPEDPTDRRSDDALRQGMKEASALRQEAAVREREEYRLMLVDIERLVSTLDDPQVIVALLEVVSRTKIALRNEEEAKQVVEGDLEPTQATNSPPQLRSEATDLLARAATLLESLLDSDISDADRVRTSFFLGVVRFRQAIPRRGQDEARKVDYDLLAMAEQIMTQLADDETVDDKWRSFAALYLGLVLPFQAQTEIDSAAQSAILDGAEDRLRQARELDAKAGVDGAFSVSQNAIPDIAFQQAGEIDRLRLHRPAPRRRNDLKLTLFAGMHRDSNVVLLGERTDLPRDISRSADYGFTTGATLGYTWDIDDRWSLGLEGRVTQLWHADVDEFDEQSYGGSVALQYELMPQRENFGPVHLRLQYDFNYTLLGRDPFLTSNAITPNVRVYWAGGRAMTEVYFKYEIRDYFEPLFDRRFERSGTYLALGITQSYKWIDMTEVYRNKGIEAWGHANDDAFAQENPDYPKRYLTPYIGFQYAWDQTQGDEFDQKAYILALGLSVPLPWGIDMDAAIDFEWQNYEGGSLVDFHRRGRQDFIQRYDIALSRTFVLRAGQLENRYRPNFDRVVMTLRANASFTLNDSNVVDRLGQSIFEFNRAVYGLAVAFTFN